MNKQCRCGPEGCADSSCAGRSVMQSNEFEAWYDTVVKYIEPADIAAWMRDAWDAGRASAPAPVALTKSALNTIGRWLADDMNKAVKNGANSISMPDELVEIAAWINASPAPVAQQVNPTMTRDELIAAAESIGMRFPTPEGQR